MTEILVMPRWATKDDEEIVRGILKLPFTTLNNKDMAELYLALRAQMKASEKS